MNESGRVRGVPGEDDHKRRGERIRAQRGFVLGSRDQAARTSGVGRQTWKDVEDGLVRDYRPGNIERMMSALGWTADSWDLMGAGGEPLEGSSSPTSRIGRIEQDMVHLSTEVAALRQVVADLQALIEGRLPPPPDGGSPPPPHRSGR